MSVRVGSATLAGPAAHSVICLCSYVWGGLCDFEAFVTYSLLLGKGDSFLDVGANIGLHSVMAEMLVGSQGQIVAVEPDAEARRWLELNLKGARGTIIALPVADQVRSLAWRSTGSTTSHLAQVGDEKVATTTIDAIVAELGIKPEQTVVKMDIEGWEPAAILGAERTLSQGLKALWVEANGQQERCDVPWEAAVRLLRRLGYHFYWPDMASGELRAFNDPPQRSPRGEYLITHPEVAQQVAVPWGDSFLGLEGK